MRISDWSSDVCSSDLVPDQVGEDDDARVAHRPARRVRRLPVALGAVAAGVGPAVHQGEAGRSVDVEHEGEDQADADRSEEHTSELQSLMRNSYAVFCLNNKTK